MERVYKKDIQGHYVFTISGGPELFPWDDVTEYLYDNYCRSQSYPERELSRTILLALHRIECLLAHNSIEEIVHNGSGPTHIECQNPTGSQHELYIHITPDDSASTPSIRRNLENLVSELQSEGLITNWRHRSLNMRHPDERTVSLIISLPNSRTTNPGPHSVRRPELSNILLRLGEAEWGGTGVIHFQFAHSAPVSLRLEQTALINFAHNRSFYQKPLVPIYNQNPVFSIDNLAEQFEGSGRRSPDMELRRLWDVQMNLISHYLMDLHSNIPVSVRQDSTPHYFMVSSVAYFLPNNQHNTVPIHRHFNRIISHLRNNRNTESPPLNFDFSYFNTEDDGHNIVINFLLTVYTTNNQQEEQLAQLPQVLNRVNRFHTDHYTWVRAWTPISLSLSFRTPTSSTSRRNRQEPAREQAEQPPASLVEIYIPMDVFQRITNESAGECDNTQYSSCL
ncbi:hypothetical protein NX722_12790 [Endozoicomonas gorgoniicola]|uniref:Uncharacterized protein n=1 Tax=Endozoicomonas gorgoniicola TaxID=1234144 RepID=A0ABT3MWX9_9GAMM|nr:hypothetical protein [Endozoicomonas gorgoniicola]MCW7553484.1 hypothetical protein [Endozoicomonas gorgoniicola]